MLIFRAPWAPLSILGDGCPGWGPAHGVTVYPCLCFAGLAGALHDCHCLATTQPPDFPCGAALTLKTLTLNCCHHLVLLLWEKRLFFSRDLERVCCCSFLTYKSRLTHSVDEQQKGSWARSLDLGWDVQRSLAAGKHSGALYLAAACKPNTWFLLSMLTWKISKQMKSRWFLLSMQLNQLGTLKTQQLHNTIC